MKKVWMENNSPRILDGFSLLLPCMTEEVHTTIMALEWSLGHESYTLENENILKPKMEVWFQPFIFQGVNMGHVGMAWVIPWVIWVIPWVIWVIPSGAINKPAVWNYRINTVLLYHAL